MKLFEITNGAIGESYVRCYAWASTVEEALTLARLAYQKKYQYMGELSDLQVDELFDGSMPAFCTMPNDAGWREDK